MIINRQNDHDMKRFWIYTLLLLSFSSCQLMKTDVEYDLEQSHSPKLSPRSDVTSFKVKYEEVRQFASIHCNNQDFSVTSLTREEDTLLYVVNYANGWMLIAGDKRVSPILAESPEGQLDLKSAPEGVLVWLDSMAEDINSYREIATKTDNDNTLLWSAFTQMPLVKSPDVEQTRYDPPIEKWYAITYSPEVIEETAWDSIPHLIPTKWGQVSPWNSKCPVDTKVPRRCYLGCAATALGQTLYYLHNYLGKPNQLYHYITCTKPTINGSTTDIGFVRGNLTNNSTRWEGMAIDCCGTSSGIEYAGDLMLDIGNRLEMKYSGEGSGAKFSVDKIEPYYNVTYSKDDYSFTTVFSNLSNNLPVMVSAYSKRGWLGLTYTKGHAWIIDGIHCIRRNYRQITEFECSENWMHHLPAYDTFEELAQAYGIQDPNDRIIETFGSNYLYLLMNWGYDGAYDNGYYSTYLTDNWYANGSNHQYLRKIYYDFH